MTTAKPRRQLTKPVVVNQKTRTKQALPEKPDPAPAQKAPKRDDAKDPAPPHRQSYNRWSWAGALVLGVVLFAVTALLAHHRTLVGWELHLFRTINDWPESLRIPMRVATIVPESLWIAVAAVAVTFLLKLYRLVWQSAVATIGGYAVAELGKQLIARPRPYELVQQVHVRIHETGNGFPSGHTMIITVILLTMWPYLPRGWRWLTLLLIPLMALSRIYLGVHEPLDVVGGFAIGLMVVGAMRVLPTGVRDFFRLD
ncbi:MAG TPA: phosphatase PAP2 family protein [Candidatus Saccharimonadales bacterium]|nr:phosphatase PAP2 family protein [Candidatus Saccharimonadales bacterium]